MKKISQILLASIFVLSVSMSFAQSTANKDEARIKLTAWVPPTIDGMPVAARKSLANKLTQVVTKNGLGGTKNARFIISANVLVNTKNILPGPPPMHAYNLDVTLYIGDGFEGTVFSSTNLTVKGVGKNPTKAYKAALKNVRTNNPEIAAFVKEGKEKIIQYYKDNCDMIIKEAQTLADQDKYRAAIFKLTGVPSACGECYEKAMNAVKPIYQKQIDMDCKKKLAEATGIWNAAQDMAAAEKAGALLAKINPDASCAPQARNLSNKIAAKVKQIDAREWKYIVKDQQQESERIQAIRDIGVAFGNGP
jgi:bacterioferritin-associated ferredoxin